MLLDLLGLEAQSALPAEEPPPRAQPKARSIVDDALPFAALILASFGPWDDAGPARAQQPRRAAVEDAAPLDALPVTPPPEILSFLDNERATTAPRTSARAFDTFPEERLLAPFLDVDGAARPPWRSAKLGADTFPEKRVLAPFVDDTGTIRAAPRPGRILDAELLTPLDQNDVVSFLDDEHAVSVIRGRARSFDTFPEERVLAPFLDVDGAVRGPWSAARTGSDTFPEKRVLAPFLDDAGIVRSVQRPAKVESSDPLSPLDQNDVVSFLDDERTATSPQLRSRAFDTFPEERLLGPHLSDEGPFKGPWRPARAIDTFPEERLLAPFLDELGAIRSTARSSTTAEDSNSLAPLDVNDVVSFLDDEPPPTAPRSFARATDTFPENRVLAPFLDETGTIRIAQRTAYVEDATPVEPLDVNDVASFLDDEHVPSAARTSSRAFDTFPEARVLAPYIGDEGPLRGQRQTFLGVEDVFVPPRVLAPILGDETLGPKIALRVFVDEPIVLPVLLPALASFLADDWPLSRELKAAAAIDEGFVPATIVRALAPFLDEEGLPPRDPHPDVYEDDTAGSLGPLLIELAFFLTDEPALPRLRSASSLIDTTFPERPFVPISPPPPPPLPRPRPRPQPIVSSGGGGGGGGGGWSRPYRTPVARPEVTSDHALIYVGAIVRATAAGVVESFVDDRGRSSIVLTADDGTRYWYADIGVSTVVNGARVRVGQPIARTKAGAPSLPTITSSPARAALPQHEAALPARPQKPTQIVYVETPPTVAPTIAPTSPKRVLVKLVPIRSSLGQPPPGEWGVVRAPERRRSPAIVYVASIGAVAALLFALSMLPSPKKRPLKRRQKRRPRRG